MRAKPCNRSHRSRSHIICLAKRFARRRVRQVNLNQWSGASAQGIMQRDRGMRISAGVQYQATRLAGGFLDPIDQLALAIGLTELQPSLARFLSQARFDVYERVMPVDFRFTCAQKVEIRSVKDINRLGHGFRLRVFPGQGKPLILRGERQMKVFVNGDEFEIEDGASLSDLVMKLTDDPRGMAIERNREIVPKSLHASTMLQPGDRLEVVQFVGGG